MPHWKPHSVATSSRWSVSSVERTKAAAWPPTDDGVVRSICTVHPASETAWISPCKRQRLRQPDTPSTYPSRAVAIVSSSRCIFSSPIAPHTESSQLFPCSPAAEARADRCSCLVSPSYTIDRLRHRPDGSSMAFYGRTSTEPCTTLLLCRG